MKKGIYTVTLFLILSIVSFSVYAAEVTIYMTDSPPEIDGELNDSCWKYAVAVTDFVIYAKVKPTTCLDQTIVHICYDKNALYVAYENAESKTSSYKVDETQRDGKVWEDDEDELFLDTNLDRYSYYQFITSVANVQYDAIDGAEYRKEWNGEYRSATKEFDKGWVLEMAIPFASIETVAPATDTVWGVNFCRHQFGGGRLGQWQSWSGILFGTFNQPGKFGDMIFGGTRDEERTNVYSMRLKAGLNMISLPLMPQLSYNTASFAQKVGATVVIKIDEERQKLIGYTAGQPDDEFQIEGGKGYIVNVLQNRIVPFVGTAWSNPLVAAAPPDNLDYSAWAFVLSGVLEGEETGKIYTVIAKNLRTGSIATDVIEPHGSRHFALVWADLSRRSVIEAGDAVEIILTDTAGQHVGVPIFQLITTEDIRRAYTQVPLSYGAVIPAKNSLFQNYPNPFNPETWIPFELAKEAEVTIRIYNTEGQLVRTIALGDKQAGVYTTKEKSAYWDGCDSLGTKVASGVYFYTLQVRSASVGTNLSIGNREFRETKRMVIIK